MWCSIFHERIYEFGLVMGSDVWNHPDKYGVSVMPKSQYEDLRLEVDYVSGTGLTLNEANPYLMSIILILYARGHKR